MDTTKSWPQFRGLGGAGVAEGSKPPIEIGPDKNVLWKVSVPSGNSSPIVVGNMLVVTAFDAGKLYTIAYDRTDGNKLWCVEAPATEIEPYHPTEGSPAASTPASDGVRIVSYFGSCGLFCYDLAGVELWKHAMPPAATFEGFGSGVSPILAEGKVVLVHDDIKDPRVIALDAKSGRVTWAKKRRSKSAFSTPVVWDTTTGKQVVVAGSRRMIGYDLHSGDEIWRFDGMPAVCCPSPVVMGGKLFYAGWSRDPEGEKFSGLKFDELLNQEDADNSGVLSWQECQKTVEKEAFNDSDTNSDGMLTREEWERKLGFLAVSGRGAFALKPGGTGDVTHSHILWKKTKSLPYVSSVIVYGGQCIMVNEGGVVTSYDTETGDKVFQKRLAATGNYYASPVAANGYIYFSSLADGAVTVLKVEKQMTEVVVSNPPLGERLSASAAIANDTLYMRTAGHLYAFVEETLEDRSHN